MENKVAFVQGRPCAHEMHQKFALSVNSDFYFVDFRMRWQDQHRSIFYRVMSWFVCAITFPNLKKYNIFYIDNLHFMPVIMKVLRLKRKKQKIVAHLGSHTLYFIYSHRFSRLTEKLHIMALRKYDALICEGLMAEDLVKKILGEGTPKLYTVINGIPQGHFPKNEINANKLSSNTILFAGHGPGNERMWYKGLDLMIKAFDKAKKSKKELEFVIVGDWDPEIQKRLLQSVAIDSANSIRFVGAANNLENYFEQAALYLHCARGEAYGLTVLIAMAYGLPVIVSEWTGAKEVVAQVDKSFIVELSEDKIADQIINYFNLPLEKKQTIGQRNRVVGKSYTEERAVKDFENKFRKMQSDFNLI
ncbi:MAG: glycosyltransferase family 4 protein [Bacteroidota bacterium]|nr:glycosyltransferase family 4 protein [Bacteroidota bacterium]